MSDCVEKLVELSKQHHKIALHTDRYMRYSHLCIEHNKEYGCKERDNILKFIQEEQIETKKLADEILINCSNLI